MLEENRKLPPVERRLDYLRAVVNYERESLKILGVMRKCRINLCTGLKGVSYDKVKICGGESRDLSDVIITLEDGLKDIDAKLREHSERLAESLQAIKDILAYLPEDHDRLLLEARYYDGWDWSKLTEAYGVTRQRLDDRRRKALDYLEVMEETEPFLEEFTSLDRKLHDLT